MNILERFDRWVTDCRWGANMRRARRWRHRLTPDERDRFDAMLICSAGHDIYAITIEDVVRAMFYSKGIPTEWKP